MADERLHLNLVDSSQQLFELDPGAAIESRDGWLFGAGSPSHPVISNAAFRRGDGIDPKEFVSRAKQFFDARGRGFSIWIRGEEPSDRGLEAAAAAAGAQLIYEMPEMVLGSPVEELDLAEGTVLRQLSEAGQASDYWEVAAASFTSNGFPPEVFGGYRNHAGLLAENIAAFIAYIDDEPASIAMTIVSHGVAGVYWVGSLERARNKGLGRAVTAAATNAGFELGAEIASLQASPMGRPIYETMGFKTAYDYRLFMSPPP